MYSPSTSWLVDSLSVCRHIGLATIAFVTGIDKNGNIYSWSHSIGDTDYWAYFIFPYRIGVVVILVSVVWVITKDAYSKIKNLFFENNIDEKSNP
jgi:hypothetical protein